MAAESKGVIRWYSDGEEKDSRLRLVRKMPLGEGRFAVMVLGLSDSQMRAGSCPTATYRPRYTWTGIRSSTARGLAWT